MSAYGILSFKNPRTGDWVSNLAKGGVRVRYLRPDGTKVWIKLTLDNTKVMNPEHDPSKHAANDPRYPRWISLIGRS